MTARRALVTGGGGFVGQWLVRSLLEHGDEVTAADLGARTDRAMLLSPQEAAAVRWMPTDVRSADDVRSAVEATRPDLVIHLAGLAFPPESDRDPTLAYDVNVLGAVRLLSELGARRSAGVLDPRVLVVGSGTQYGRHDASEMPLPESAEQRPTTTYAASKSAQETAALQIARVTGLRVVCTRSFNHSGVGHAPQYLLPSLVDRVVALRNGRGRATLALGNDVVRDYLHVADVVRAYLQLLESGVSGAVYNVSSGQGVSARELAIAVMRQAGVAVDIATEPALVRPQDIPVLVGSPARLMADTGWTITRSYLDIIDDLLDAQAH